MHPNMRKTLKVTLWTLMSVVLLVVGVVAGVYSVWWQRDAVSLVVDAVNRREDTHLTIEEARLIFPLKVKVRGMSLVQHGDTMIRMGAADVDVRLMPLLDGRVDVTDALLQDARYQIGTRDSATCITLTAERINAAPASVQLSDTMRICLHRGAIAGGVVDMYINPVDTAAPKPPGESSPLNIVVEHLTLSDFAYRMNLLPAIDSLGTHIRYGVLGDVAIDLAGQSIDVGDFSGIGMDIACIMPDSAMTARMSELPQKADSAATPSAPWTVNVRGLHFGQSKALYATRGQKPLPGMDFAYIALDSMNLDIEDFYNRAAELRVPLCISGRERSGVVLHADGTLAIDSTALYLRQFDVATDAGTRIKFDAMLGTGGEPEPPIRLDLAYSEVAVGDFADIMPDMSTYLRPLSRDRRIDLEAAIRGSIDNPEIRKLSLHVPGALQLNGRGTLHNLTDPDRMYGSIDLSGRLGDIEPWRRLVMGPNAGVRIPPMTIDGEIDFRNGAYSGGVTAVTADGELALDGSFDGRGNTYDVAIDACDFPVDAFLPSLGISSLTATLTAKGQGFDIMSPKTNTVVDIDLDRVTYNGDLLTDITADLQIADGNAILRADSRNPSVDFSIEGYGNIRGEHYAWIAAIDGRNIDLNALKFSDTPATIAVNADINADFDASNPLLMDAAIDLRRMVYTHDEGSRMNVDRVRGRIISTDTTVNVNISNRDLFALFSLPTGLQAVMNQSDSIVNTLAMQLERRRIDIPAIQHALPRFEMDLQAGSNNMLTQILADADMGFNSIRLRAYNDTVMALDGELLGMTIDDTRLDSVGVEVHQHGDHLHYATKMRNLPGTLDEWASVDLTGFFRPGRLGLNLRQSNIEGQTGFLIGGELELSPDSTATLRLTPLNPIIDYQQWTANEGNFIRYDFDDRHIDADLRMRSAFSSLEMYTEHAHESENVMHGVDEDFIFKLSEVRLQDWIALNPFAPPVKGVISADMRFSQLTTILNGEGQVSLTGLTYGKEKVGDIRADFDLTTQESGLTHTNVDVWVNGNRSITLAGAITLGDSVSTSPYNLDLKMIHFPLSTCNAFLPGVAKLSGTLNGTMDVSGNSDRPILDGSLQFDNAAITMNMLGTTFAISDTVIPVRKNIIDLRHFAISGYNANPLTIDGKVDISEMSNVSLDVALSAHNMQILNSNRAAKGADMYGKAYISLDAKARGTTSLLRTSGTLSVLAPSNFTYIMPDAVNTIQNQSVDDMVHFVNFNDSLAMAAADSVAAPNTMTLIGDFALNINEGTTIGIDLSSNGKNRLQLNSQGTLNYNMNPMNGGRLIGRLNILDGYVRYTPPLMSEKKFTFKDDSYVAFSGDMLNPQLNINGVDRIRANVTQEGQNSRLIYFDVSLKVTGSLERMDVAFDMSTNDDITVANELASMSESQRANEAMNLLLYNVYTGPGTKANASLSANPLYSFLSSQLNSWASQAIKGVDLSFGIDTYDRTTQSGKSQTTQYSYNISKSLFNERFRIAVGGNYSTDANADENLSRNIISDISAEYYLNNAHTTYFRIFRHTGYESILEGEITQTGVGFVYRRKIRRVSDMFRFGRRRNTDNTDNTKQKPDSVSTATKQDETDPR